VKVGSTRQKLVADKVSGLHMPVCIAPGILGLLPHQYSTAKKHYLEQSTDSLISVRQSPCASATCEPQFENILERIIMIHRPPPTAGKCHL
jgi:hypothetical protein